MGTKVGRQSTVQDGQLWGGTFSVFSFGTRFEKVEPWTLKIRRQRLRQKTGVGTLLTVPRTSLQDLQTSLQVPVPVPFEDPLLAFFRPSTFPMPSLPSNAGAASLRRE